MVNKTKYSARNVVAYLQGNIRSFLFRINKYLISKSTLRHYKTRIKDADECYLNGECLHCGCKTPELFFADKACSKQPPCYLEMDNFTNRTYKKLCGLLKRYNLVKSKVIKK